MRAILALMLLTLLAACGADGEPGPVTAEIGTIGDPDEEIAE